MLHIRSNGKPQKPMLSASVRRGLPVLLRYISVPALLADKDMLAAAKWLRDTVDYHATPEAAAKLRHNADEAQKYKPTPKRRYKKRAPALPVSHPDMLERS